MFPPKLIEDPAHFTPLSSWTETRWESVSEGSLLECSSKPRLCPAALCPNQNSKPDSDGFAVGFRWMLNAATGYISQPDTSLCTEVLRRFRSEFHTAGFIGELTTQKAKSDSCFRAERCKPPSLFQPRSDLHRFPVHQSKNQVFNN